MTRKSRYMIAFDFMEEQMFQLGTDREYINSVFDGKVEMKDMSRPIAMYSMRLRWLDSIADSLSVIHEEVNQNTKTIIEMLYMQNKSMEDVAEKLNISLKRVINQHFLLVDEVMDMLGVGGAEKTKNEKTDRGIPESVKRKVRERDGNKCTVCESRKKLHFHHIKRFSDGGTHNTYNLTLLCAACHAKEHEGESAYRMLIKMAEG